MENSYNEKDPLGILSKPKQKQTASSQEGGNDPLGILKKKADSEHVGTPSANGTPPTSPSKSSSSSVSAEAVPNLPAQPAKPQDYRRKMVDLVLGKSTSAATDIENNQQIQKAIPGLIARQKSKAVISTNGKTRMQPAVAAQAVEEAIQDPLLQVWTSKSADPVGQIEEESLRIINSEKYPTTARGLADYNNRLKILDGVHTNLQNQVAGNATTAAAYLKQRGIDIDGLPDEAVKQIKTGNRTEQAALAAVDRGRLANQLLSTSSIEDAAVEFAASKDPALARQIQTLGTNYQHDLPNAMQGRLISEFLENPDVIARAEADPNVKNKYTVAAANLNSNFPDYAKTRIANIIGQERENRGDNNGIVNIVGQKATDKLVDELIAEGKLTASDKLVYQKYIQPKLSVLQSVGRGVGRAIPLTMAFTDEAPIETPGLAENFQNSFVGTLHGMAKSIEDTPSPLGAVVGGDQKGKLYDALKSDYTAKALDPKGTWHAITQNTGHLTGFMVPMILGGEIAQGVGIPAKAASALTAYLTFEGQNAEQAIKMFPGDPTKQYLHTALATGGDMFLTELLPLAKAASGAKTALRSEITNTINSFTDGNITAAVAKETLLKKAAKIVAGLPKENAKMGATMAGFSLFHNALDAAFGGRDVSAGQVADQAVDAFKSGFLGGSIISLATAGNNQKLTGSLVREMAERPDHFKALIEQGAKMDPSLAATANERIANLNEASVIWKDVQELPITDAQKEKYLLSALNQKVWERKAEATSDDVVKRGYQEKAKVAGQAKEAIYNGQDPATEHQSFTQPEQAPADAFGYKEKIAAAKTEEEKAQIDKDYAAFQAGEQVAAEPKPEATEGNPLVRRETMLDQARELVRNSEIKGDDPKSIKDAAENDPAKFEDYLQNIAEQAQDPGSRAVTLDTYGKDIVDLAERLSDSKQTSKNNNVTLSNGEQPTVSNRLSPEEKRGNQIGGSELQAASDAVGRISDTSENNKASVEELRDKQGKELEQISKNNGTWVADPFKEFGNAPQAIGSEHNVYLDKDGQTLTKLNSAVKYDTWQDYLDNLAIHNTLFPTEAYTLKGFTDLSGDLTAVVQQPVVRGKEATFEQVKEDMAKMGFEHIPPSENPETQYDFVNKKTGVVISDLHGENVLVDANGKLRYIDTVIKKKPVENEATIPPTEASATDQGTTENSQGAKEATKFENPEEAVKHINSLPLSHVEGTRMGAKQAEGVYLSTEDANRYSSESNPARSVTVDIKNPKVTDYVENTNLQHEKIGQLLDANEVSASDISSEYRPELEKFVGKRDVTNEDVSNWYRSKEGNRINEDYFEQTVRTKAAKLITEQYKSEGHDALYIPATKNTEGELIVFDSNAVKFEPANELSKEQKYTTKTGKYSVEYRDGKRVVVDKQGNVLPEYIKVKTKKGILTDKEGNPRMVEQRNKVRDTVLREHEEAYQYNFGAKADPNEMPNGLSDKQAGEWVIENSSNPAELANLYKKTSKEGAELNEIEQAIADNGIGKVKSKSYYSFGDRNNMTATKARTYLNDTKGRSIDVIAKEISDHTGKDVTPQHIVDYIDRFPKGDATVLRDGELHQQAATKFEELTGIPLTERVAEKAALDHYAAAKREAAEVGIARDTPDEEIKKWITETVENEYSTDNFSDFIGESADPIREDKKEPGNVEGVSENTGTEMAGRSTTSAEQGSSETPNSDGQDGPPAENGATTVEPHSEDWTPINKAQLTEAKTLLKKFPFGKSETWDNSVSKGIASLAKEAVNSESLYETASRKVTGWAEQIKRAIDSDGKSTFNPSDEEIAQMAFHRVMTNKQIGELEADLTSPIEAIRNAAELTMDNLQSQKEMVDYVLHNTATTAGRAFNIRQMVGRIDSENNLQVKRMEIIRKQGGEPLSEKQELALRDIADESAIIAKERAELEKKKADQDFEAAVKIEVERRLKEKGANKTTSIKEGGKKVADVIRSLKMPKGGLRSDFTLGTWDIAIEGIAKIVEGGASIADAVKKLIEDKVIAFKDENARNLFEEYVTNYEKHDIVGRIEELANEEGSNTLTKSAVGEGTINDLVRHYIDKGVRGNEILERVHQDLQSVFPEISKQDIRDAYLKEGEYRFEKKEDINRETQAATQQLKTIAKLQTDLSDLQNERELRKRSGEKREPTAEEKSLQSEKEELLKKKRVEEVNKRIKEVNDRLDVLKNNRNKKTERVDADIEAARKRLQSEIGKLGLKLERGSKDEKALKEAVAEQHNKRADNIIEGIDKRLTDPKITAQERAALENAKKSIEKSKISPDSALDLSRAISKAHENIELGRKELASISSLSDLKKQTGLAQVEMGRDQISAEQQILLDRYKKTLQNKINENNRRIAAKEYLDKEPIYLKNTDAEAIKLEIQERQVNAKFNKLAKDAQWQNMSRRQKAFNVIQNLYIASLVGHMSTLAKVAASAVTKQPLNTITSQTFGRIGGRIFSKIRPALRGEGAESLRKETQRYKAHYGVMGENKMLRIAAEGKEKAQQANEKFNKAKDRLEELETINGTDSKEYKSFLSGEYKKAETAQKKALLDNISNSMYEWIGGNSFKDAAELFLHSAPQLEQILGKSPRESWGEYNKREKVMFVLSSIAATHGVLKNFSARAEFAASFVARLENKMRNGIDISTPDEILKTVNENYINFQRGKYQEDNPITGGFKAALNGIEKMGERNPQFKTAADVMTGLLKFENPIVRTPINIAKEAIVEYALGVPVAIMKYRGAFKEAKTEAKTIGVAANEMKQYLREYMAKLDPDKADFIYRAFRKGGFGLGMMALAATGAVQFGGFYNRDDRRKKSEKLGVGEIQIGDYQLSKLQAKILTHTSAIFPLLLWTNYERVKEKQERKGKDTVDSNWEATKEDIQGMIDQVPIGTEFQNPLRGVNIPVVGPIMQDIAEGIDTDESGNKIERKPTGNVLNQLWQGMEMRIPVARENVPKKKK